MKLNDSVIAHIAQLVQLAILTGTDIVDNMRMIVLTETDGNLELDPEYEAQSEDNIHRMLAVAATASAPEIECETDTASASMQNENSDQ
tara:strand:+ start:520 stop:786 length:267 start_codon:yes stop_codon:yes gene_type:complete